MRLFLSVGLIAATGCLALFPEQSSQYFGNPDDFIPPPVLDFDQPGSHHITTAKIDLTGFCTNIPNGTIVELNGDLKDAPLSAKCVDGRFEKQISLFGEDGLKNVTLSYLENSVVRVFEKRFCYGENLTSLATKPFATPSLGTASDTHKICTTEQWAAADFGAAGSDHRTAHFELYEDLDFSASGASMSQSFGQAPVLPFEGKFNGRGHSIRGFSLSAPSSPMYFGLFARISDEVIIENLILEDCLIDSDYGDAGALVGDVVNGAGGGNGVLRRIYINDCSVTGLNYAGAVVGAMGSLIDFVEIEVDENVLVETQQSVGSYGAALVGRVYAVGGGDFYIADSVLKPTISSHKSAGLVGFSLVSSTNYYLNRVVIAPLLLSNASLFRPIRFIGIDSGVLYSNHVFIDSETTGTEEMNGFATENGGHSFVTTSEVFNADLFDNTFDRAIWKIENGQYPGLKWRD